MWKSKLLDLSKDIKILQDKYDKIVLMIHDLLVLVDNPETDDDEVITQLEKLRLEIE